MICRAGDPAREIYVVARGEIEVRLPDRTLIHVLRRGGVAGEFRMFGLTVQQLVARNDLMRGMKS